jgi:DNA-binding transcriptional MerR regulator
MLGTVVYGAKVVSLFSLVGNDLLVKTISSTTSSICSAVTQLTSYDQPYIKEVLNELTEIDLEFSTSVIKELVDERKDKDTNASIKQALWGVNETLEKINNELQELKEAIDDHNQKYFSGWRIFNNKKVIVRIRELKKILNSRYSILIDLLKIYP